MSEQWQQSWSSNLYFSTSDFLLSPSASLGCVSPAVDGVFTSRVTISIWLLSLYHLLHAAASPQAITQLFSLKCAWHHKKPGMSGTRVKVTDQSRYNRYKTHRKGCMEQQLLYFWHKIAMNMFRGSISQWYNANPLRKMPLNDKHYIWRHSITLLLIYCIYYRA